MTNRLPRSSRGTSSTARSPGTRKPSAASPAASRSCRHERGKPTVERFEPAEFLARLLQHVPEPRLHQLRYFGRYSNAARARRSRDDSQARPAVPTCEQEPDTTERRQARRAWAHLIHRV
ncbi:MAG: transposase [Thermoanaerobaculia bacterium]